MPTVSFANEETEIHNGGNVPEDTHPVSYQNPELPSPRELHCVLLDTQNNISFKWNKHRNPCVYDLLNMQAPNIENTVGINN